MSANQKNVASQSLNRWRWPAATAFVAALLLATSADAALYNYSGVVALCPDTSPPCAATLLSVGDPFSGSITVNDAAVQPDSSFGFAQVTAFTFSVGSLNVTSDSSSVVEGNLSTDGASELVDGFLSILIPAGGTGFGNPDTLLTFDVATATWIAYDVDSGLDFPLFTGSGSGEFTFAVPLPGAWVMLLPALVWLGSLRRANCETQPN